ncbi:hypothetical protein NLG97_g7478 [Lecanicillium saksenae]|uniref:Uncharacterized protein n=1 Tax=Lecanicillium saksenae TaxID=468837 RepID=A0ACC1QPN8_9HYPO|nr:hypothetical protein NLG97_g7478 [Lecanicillium saksenae]
MLLLLVFAIITFCLTRVFAPFASLLPLSSDIPIPRLSSWAQPVLFVHLTLPPVSSAFYSSCLDTATGRHLRRRRQRRAPQEATVEDLGRNAVEAHMAMVVDAGARDITTGLAMITMLLSHDTTTSTSLIHTLTIPLLPRAILKHQLPATRISLLLLLNGVLTTAAIMFMGMGQRQCRPPHILPHIRRKVTRQRITLPRSRFLMRRLSTIPMAHHLPRTHLSGMGPDKCTTLLLADLAEGIMTRVQGALTLLNTTRMEDLPQHHTPSRTTKTRNMGSTRVAAVEGTEMNPAQHKNDSASLGKKKKRKTNTLGLTPGMESESEDDEGEEKALSELIGEEALRISDVAAFLAERRKNYPTKARTDAKKAAAQAQKNEDKAASLEKEADKLRRQLRKVESSIKRKREQGDEGDEMRDASDDSSDDEPPEALSTKASSKTIPSRPLPTAAGKKADVTRHCKYYSTGGTCGKKGKCRFVHDPEIREAAIKEREANNGRLTIQQRLILNDKEQEDLTVLQSIQYLRQKGIMSEAIAASAAALNGGKANGDGETANVKKELKDPGPPLVVSSTSPYQLPPPPPSLPRPPIKTEASTPATSQSSCKAEGENGGTETKHYEGWLLRPYGSNGKESNVAP